MAPGKTSLSLAAAAFAAALLTFALTRPDFTRADPAAAAAAEPARSLAQIDADRLKLAEDGWSTARKLEAAGMQVEPGEIERWSRRLMQARLATAAAPADQRKALEDHLARMRDFEALATARHNQGLVGPLEPLSAQYARAEAERLLAESKP
jgi:hypothetical protein